MAGSLGMKGAQKSIYQVIFFFFRYSLYYRKELRISTVKLASTKMYWFNCEWNGWNIEDNEMKEVWSVEMFPFVKGDEGL